MNQLEQFFTSEDDALEVKLLQQDLQKQVSNRFPAFCLDAPLKLAIQLDEFDRNMETALKAGWDEWARACEMNVRSNNFSANNYHVIDTASI